MMNFRRWHKWLSVVVAVQLVIWLGTGLYFALADHSKAAGNTYRKAIETGHQKHKAPLADITSLPVKDAKTVRLFYLQNTPFYLVEKHTSAHASQPRSTVVFNAVNGTQVQLDDALIREQAMRSYSGPGTIQSVRLLKGPISELPGYENPVWAVEMDDDIATTVYLRADTAQVIAHVDDPRRLRNLMFTLHFMDYANEGSFNNLFSQLFGAMALLLTLTGIWWLYLIQKNKVSRYYRRKSRLASAGS
ncbi:PepSY domain-containing protein [Alteromonas sp. H39]|uniref:PepSY domain-containing protein n=1 Tax=Alteromonas sp. H39 TaxID=3389876 RepID=UPI0039E0A3C5